MLTSRGIFWPSSVLQPSVVFPKKIWRTAAAFEGLKQVPELPGACYAMIRVQGCWDIPKHLPAPPTT